MASQIQNEGLEKAVEIGTALLVDGKKEIKTTLFGVAFESNKGVTNILPDGTVRLKS